MTKRKIARDRWRSLGTYATKQAAVNKRLAAGKRFDTRLVELPSGRWQVLIRRSE